jgi:hypothetical protein
VREDFDGAAAILPRVPEASRYKIARLLQARELPHIAITVTTDDDHKFELAVVLKRLDVLRELIEKAPTQAKWRQLGDIALQLGFFDVAEAALWRSADYNGLLLLFTCTANSDGLRRVAAEAFRKKRLNVAFSAFHALRDHSGAVDSLLASGMFAEAAFYARTYAHDRIMDAVTKWRQSMASQPKLREAIADPEAYPNLFPGIDINSAAAAAATGAGAAAAESDEQQEVVSEQQHHHVGAAQQDDEVVDDEEERMVAAAAAAAATAAPSAPAPAAAAHHHHVDPVSAPSAAAPSSSNAHAAPPAKQHHDADDLWDEVAGDAEKAHHQPKPAADAPAAAPAHAATAPAAKSPPKAAAKPFDDDDDLFAE